MNESEKKPFWKVPMMWLVIGLPLASVVAGVSLVVIAVRSGGADSVRDDVQRVSQIQTTDLGPDEQAQQLGLSAVLRADAGAVDVIAVSGEFRRKEPLHLLLQHPSSEKADVLLELAPSTSGWHGTLTLDDSHDWIVQLAPTDGTWRIHGRLPRQQHATRLAPSLAR